VKLIEGANRSDIIARVEASAATETSLASLQRTIVDTLVALSPDCAWAGFYMLDPSDHRMLVLGPFNGAPTDHVRIPIDFGICGAAVAQDETVIVDDVNADARYLACSLDTKSEIVAPIRVRGIPVGEIDVDSHRLAAFDAEDRRFFDRIAAVVGDFMEGRQSGY
jgi:L-methionine (R)-S-oxide reductase